MAYESRLARRVVSWNQLTISIARKFNMLEHLSSLKSFRFDRPMLRVAPPSVEVQRGKIKVRVCEGRS